MRLRQEKQIVNNCCLEKRGLGMIGVNRQKVNYVKEESVIVVAELPRDIE